MRRPVRLAACAGGLALARLFLDFRAGGVVRTAAFTVDVARGAS